jgi:hypothetical protein
MKYKNGRSIATPQKMMPMVPPARLKIFTK